MFHALKGIVSKKAANLVVIDTGGVEYAADISRHAFHTLPEPGENVRMVVHLLHREDQMRLYGFADEEERDWFLRLLRVEGIGPKLAMKILSAKTPGMLAEEIEAGDAAALATVSGLGARTAQKIILAFKGQLATMENKTGATQNEEFAESLAEMGFDRKRAQTVVAQLLREERFAVLAAKSGTQGVDLARLESELFRQAILLLSSGAKT